VFTGLVQQKGSVLFNHSVESGNRLAIKAEFPNLVSGESIAVNGVCLTWLPTSDHSLSFDVSPETLNITSLGDLKQGDWVNLERSMLAGDRFGGHYVTGHVDGMATIERLNPNNTFMEVTLGGFAQSDIKYLIPKGSITIDGVSLTINSVRNGSIDFMLVPHTLDKTTLNKLVIGQRVNVEFDYLARIVAHQLQSASLI